MIKVYKKLTSDQKERGVIFSSCLSTQMSEMQKDTIHEVFKTDDDKENMIRRLKDDKFFNNSPWRFNIIRT
jgi:hypothetical protein